MKLFVRAVVTGFAMAMGAALFKKVAPYLDLDDKSNDKKKKADEAEEESERAGSEPVLDS